MSTGIIALVFSVMAFFIPSTEMLKSSVESTMTGFPPAHNTAIAVAEYVYAGTMTSSPSFSNSASFHALSTNVNASSPLEQLAQ